MPIITRKIELHLLKDGLTDEEYQAQWGFLRQIDNNLYKAATRISSHCFFNDEYVERLKLQSPEYKNIKKQLANSKKNNLPDGEKKALLARRKELDKDFQIKKKEFLQTSERNSTYKVASEEFLNLIPGEILTNLNQLVTKRYSDTKDKVRNGERVLSTYKKGMPIPFPIKKEAPFQRDNDTFILKWYKNLRFALFFGKDRSNNRVIVDRLIYSAEHNHQKGEDYVICDSSIQLVEKDRKTKIFLLLVLDIPVQRRVLDKGLVVGIDLGISVPLCLATNKNPDIRRFIGDYNSFWDQRMAFQRRYRGLQKSLQCTAGGKGREKKLEPLNKLKEKERNWTKNQNHNFSREVIKFALSIGAGTIHLEDLSNFGKDEKGNVLKRDIPILRNWSYHELQTMIENKAKMEGIEVKYINPAYTSQICSVCGTRGARINQKTFQCLNPECSEYGKENINADFNAARNIAMSTRYMKENKENKENKEIRK